MKKLLSSVLAVASIALVTQAHAENYTWLATINSVANNTADAASPWGSIKPGDVISGRLTSNAPGTTLVVDSNIDAYDYLQIFDVSRQSGSSISFKVGAQNAQTTYFNLVSHSYASKNQSNTSALASTSSVVFNSTPRDPLYTPNQFNTGDITFQVLNPEKDYTPWSNAYKLGYPSNLTLNSKTPSRVSIYSYVPTSFVPTSDYYMLRYADPQGSPLVIHYINGRFETAKPLNFEQFEPTNPFWIAYEAYKASGKTVVKQFILSATVGSLIRVQ